LRGGDLGGAKTWGNAKEKEKQGQEREGRGRSRQASLNPSEVGCDFRR
jgi:hypothetical protein